VYIQLGNHWPQSLLEVEEESFGVYSKGKTKVRHACGACGGACNIAPHLLCW
jgi:hypothetical protein